MRNKEEAERNSWTPDLGRTAQAESANSPRVRRWPRYRISVPIRVILATPEKTRIVEGRGEELNEGGMAILAGVELKIGDSTVIEVTLPYSDTPIRVRANVRDRAGYRFGIEFMGEGPAEARDIERLRLSLRMIGQTSRP